MTQQTKAELTAVVTALRAKRKQLDAGNRQSRLAYERDRMAINAEIVRAQQAVDSYIEPVEPLPPTTLLHRLRGWVARYL